MGGKLIGTGSVFRKFTDKPKCKIFSCTRMHYISNFCCQYCERRDVCNDPCLNDPAKCGMCFDPNEEEQKEKKKPMYSLDSLDLPDAPDIARAERTGLKPGEVPFDDEEVTCPICGAMCETIYKDVDGDVCGCDVCIKRMDAYEYQRERDSADND